MDNILSTQIVDKRYTHTEKYPCNHDLDTNLSVLFEDEPNNIDITMETDIPRKDNSIMSCNNMDSVGTLKYNVCNVLIWDDGSDVLENPNCNLVNENQDGNSVSTEQFFRGNDESSLNHERMIIDDLSSNQHHHETEYVGPEHVTLERRETNISVGTKATGENSSACNKTDVFNLILESLRNSNQQTSNLNKWNAKTVNDIELALANEKEACKHLSKKELLICIDVVNEYRQAGMKPAASWNKSKLYALLWQLVNAEKVTMPRKVKRLNPKKTHSTRLLCR